MDVWKFLACWLLWNIYWSIPYGCLMSLYRQDKKRAIGLTMFVVFFVLQVIAPLFLFQLLFDMSILTPFALILGFLVICMPAAICNVVVPRMMLRRWLLPISYSLLSAILILVGVFVWASCLKTIVMTPYAKVVYLALLGGGIPVFSCLLIRWFVLRV